MELFFPLQHELSALKEKRVEIWNIAIMTEETPQAAYQLCFQRVYEIVRTIPVGKVMTYGQIANMILDVCRSPVPAIQVGRAMAASSRYAPEIPWWRVIGQEGSFGVLRKLHLSQQQKDLLAGEGILPDDVGRYDLTRYLFTAK